MISLLGIALFPFIACSGLFIAQGCLSLRAVVRSGLFKKMRANPTQTAVYRPLNAGGRFALKAARPSAPSSESRTLSK